MLKSSKTSLNNIEKDSLFLRITRECRNYNPVLLFLLGYHYCKSSKDYNQEHFFTLGNKIQEMIRKERLSQPEIFNILRNLMEISSKSEVNRFNKLYLKEAKSVIKFNSSSVRKKDIKTYSANRPKMNYSKNYEKETTNFRHKNIPKRLYPKECKTKSAHKNYSLRKQRYESVLSKKKESYEQIRKI